MSIQLWNVQFYISNQLPHCSIVLSSKRTMVLGEFTLWWCQMNAKASQFTFLSIVCSAVCSGWHQRRYQSSASLVFCAGYPSVTGGFPKQSVSNAESCPCKYVIMPMLLHRFCGQLSITRKTKFKSPGYWVGFEIIHLLKPKLLLSMKHMLLHPGSQSFNNHSRQALNKF